jgi:hypothetical protein
MAMGACLFRAIRSKAGHQPFDHEQGGERPAERDRQIGHAGSDERKLGDALEPGGLDQLDAPPQHEQVGGEHADFEKPAEHLLSPRTEKRRHDADPDMQIFAVADDGGEK